MSAPTPVDPSTVESLHEWMEQGEELFASVESGRLGFFVSVYFKLGAWWADRPWRVRDTTKGKRHDF